MNQGLESERPVSALKPSLAPEPSIEPATSVHHASEATLSVMASSDNLTEHRPSSPAQDQSARLPALVAPITLATNPGGDAFVPLASDQGHSTLPLGSNGPSKSIQRKPVPRTSLGLEEGDPEQRGLPSPPNPPEVRLRDTRIGLEESLSPGPRSGIDYIVPVNGKTTLAREKTVGDRLEPILSTAIAERDKYALKAKVTGYALNIAIALQVILGALTTGLASVAALSHQATVATAILGGFSTITASYLARARGSNEPELSITRVKDLDQFIRQSEAFQMDFGQTTGNKYDKELQDLRNRFEELLGNSDGQRRLASLA